MRSLYGLQDPSIPKERADEVVRSVFQLFRKPIDENILKEEFVRLLESGGDLLDCEFDGHHGDEEWEVLLSPQRSPLEQLSGILSLACPFLVTVI